VEEDLSTRAKTAPHSYPIGWGKVEESLGKEEELPRWGKKFSLGKEEELPRWGKRFTRFSSEAQVEITHPWVNPIGSPPLQANLSPWFSRNSPIEWRRATMPSAG